MKKHIPNLITCSNLISGAVACIFALRQQYDWAMSFIILGAVFDFFDGFAARLLHVSSPVGKELDSLADVITFGLAPSMMIYAFLLQHLPEQYSVAAYIAFVMAAASALRLAKFNLDERQSMGFIGLPTPANALFWSALLVHISSDGTEVATWVSVLILVGVFFLSWMLLCELPMFAFKFKSFGWKGNELRYTFILVSIPLLLFMGFQGISIIVLLYILVSFIAFLQSRR